MTTFDLLQPATAAQRIVGSRGASRSWPHWLRLVVGVVSRTVLGTLVGLLLWAATASAAAWFVLRELSAANRRIEILLEVAR